MTLTDSPTAEADTTAEAAAAVGAVGAPSPVEGLARPVTTSDSTVVGRLFVGVSLLLGLGTAVIGVLLALERLGPSSPTDVFGGLNSYFRMWTLYRVSFLLLVVMPLLLGVAMTVVPSQIGAANLAFPRAALASFWSWLIGAVILVASALADGGWGALDGVTARESDAMALTLLGTAMVIFSLLVGALTVATTVISSRAAGMGLLEVPAFAWSMLVAAAVWLLTLPVAVANIVLVYADLRGRPAIAFGRAEGPDIWLQIDWMVEQPAVYAMALPVLGIAVDAVGRAVGAKSALPEAAVVAAGLFGLLAVGGWSQDYFTAPNDHRDGLVYVAVGLAVIVPVAATLGAVAELVFRGSKAPEGLSSTRFVGAVAGLLLLAGATGVGVLRVIEPFDLLETVATSAVFNAVAVASLAAAVAALWHWAPLLAGRELKEAPGRATVALLLVGGALLAIPNLVSGLRGTADLPARAVDGGDLDRLLDAAAFAGSALVALALLAMLGVAASVLRSSVSAVPLAEEGAAA